MKSTPSLLTLNLSVFESFTVGRGISSHNTPVFCSPCPSYLTSWLFFTLCV
jgi:hypothetical protein